MESSVPINFKLCKNLNGGATPLITANLNEWPVEIVRLLECVSHGTMQCVAFHNMFDSFLLYSKPGIRRVMGFCRSHISGTRFESGARSASLCAQAAKIQSRRVQSGALFVSLPNLLVCLSALLIVAT